MITKGHERVVYIETSDVDGRFVTLNGKGGGCYEPGFPRTPDFYHPPDSMSLDELAAMFFGGSFVVTLVGGGVSIVAGAELLLLIIGGMILTVMMIGVALLILIPLYLLYKLAQYFGYTLPELPERITANACSNSV